MRPAAWLSVLLAMVPLAVLAALPYETVQRTLPQLPETRQLQQSLAEQAFPQLWAEDVLEAQYSEYQANTQDFYGFITCRTREPGLASLLYYSADQQTYLVLRRLPLLRNHLATYTVALPPSAEDRGMCRLLVWQTAAGDSQMRALAATAYPTTGQLTEVAADHWFPRAVPAVVRLPWNNPFRLPLAAPADFAGQNWPLCHAELESDNTVRCKDCAVQFNGMLSVGYDERGSFGRWLLDWGTALVLSFEIPPGQRLAQTQLLIYGVPDATLQNTAPPRLSVSANGWQLPEVDSQAATATALQPIAIELSQYLQPGSNRIELGLDAFSNARFFVETLEVWAR
jgi:hypothetical protein